MAGMFSGMFGLSGKQPDFYGIQAKNEAQRRGLINLGMKNINAVFGGGTTDVYSPANANGAGFNPATDYYALDTSGNPYVSWAGANAGQYKGAGGGSLSIGGIQKKVDPIHVDPIAGLISGLFGDGTNHWDRVSSRAGSMFQGGDYYTKHPETYEGFTPKFFEDRAQAYYDYALPQVNEQYDTNRRAMMYGLSNRGLLHSTQAERAGSLLERTAGQAKQGVVEQAIEQANTLKKTVEDSRNQAIQQLYQTADPGMALNQAVSTAQQARQPSAFGPIANMFSNLANQWYTNQILNNYRTGGGTPNSSYSDYYNLAAPLGPVTYGGR